MGPPLLHALRNRNFSLLWAGQAVSGLGTWINFVGLNLYVYELTGSGALLGSFLVVRMLPALLFGPAGGYLADRYSRRDLMVACDLSRALLVLGFLLTTDLRVFFLLGVTLSAVDKVFAAARDALLPDLVGEEELLEANALTRVTGSSSSILGPAIGGLLVSSCGFTWVFVIDAGTFLASVLSLLLIRQAPKHRERPPTEGTVRDEFRMAYEFFRAHQALVFLALVRLVDAFGSGAYNTALPVFSRALDTSRGGAYGWLVSAWALGTLCGALLVRPGARRLRLDREQLFCASMLLMAGGMGLTFHFESPWPAMLAIFLGGMGDGVGGILFNTVLMQEIPDGMRGKVLGSVNALVFTAVACGMAASGFLLDSAPLVRTTDGATLFIATAVIIGYFLYRRKKEGLVA